jgi:hypothetical protein
MQIQGEDGLRKNLSLKEQRDLHAAGKLPPTILPSDPTPKPVEVDPRIDIDRNRLRTVVLKLRSQMRDINTLTPYLSCLTGLTAIDGRLPFTPRPVIVVEDRAHCLMNMLSHAYIQWGLLVRGEEGGENPNPFIDELESIAERNFGNFGAYPKDKGGVIHVLRHKDDEKKIGEERAAAKEKALQMKANKLAGDDTL